MRRGKRIATVAAAAALAVAGCGGDDEAGTDAAKTATTETAAKTATARTAGTEPAKTESAKTESEKREGKSGGGTTQASPSDPALGVDAEVTPVSPGSKTCRVELSNGQSSQMPCETARRIFGD